MVLIRYFITKHGVPPSTVMNMTERERILTYEIILHEANEFEEKQRQEELRQKREQLLLKHNKR